MLIQGLSKELGPVTEASTIRLADSDPLEETCLGVGVGGHREARSL